MSLTLDTYALRTSVFVPAFRQSAKNLSPMDRKRVRYILRNLEKAGTFALNWVARKVYNVTPARIATAMDTMKKHKRGNVVTDYKRLQFLARNLESVHPLSIKWIADVIAPYA